ncbi:MAG: hypothetical protein V9E94_14405 [Microthrixaceae bacterium]
MTDSQSTDSPTTEGPAPAPAGSTAAPAPAGHANMLNLKLKVWRQAGPDVHGHFEDYTTTVAGRRLVPRDARRTSTRT